ncbi:hypothetical protein V1477_004960 [Vespula maculifrons]|uniref:Uncharacterized protein n=1 Tax=Vespula maculifrons TaxID=7453 RepID=A0ABD2CPF7_VESMC
MSGSRSKSRVSREQERVDLVCTSPTIRRTVATRQFRLCHGNFPLARNNMTTTTTTTTSATTTTTMTTTTTTTMTTTTMMTTMAANPLWKLQQKNFGDPFVPL